MNLPAIKARVGLVDDDLSMRRAVCRLLRSHGYACLSYESAEAALHDPTFLQMDCAIVDVQLGGMNGFELERRLNGLRTHIPIIFITAQMESDLPQHLEDSTLLFKPFDDHQLIALVEQWTETITTDS